MGERLGIKYLGRQTTYEGYRVVWQDVAPPDWNAIGVEAAAEAVVEGIDAEVPVGEALATADDYANEADDDGIPF